MSALLDPREPPMIILPSLAFLVFATLAARAPLDQIIRFRAAPADDIFAAVGAADVAKVKRLLADDPYWRRRADHRPLTARTTPPLCCPVPPRRSNLRSLSC